MHSPLQAAQVAEAPVYDAQNRESGHEVQGRDRSAHHVFRSSLSDPVYYTRSSMSDPSYPGPQRGMVTPQVNVAEGVTLQSVLAVHLQCNPCCKQLVKPEMPLTCSPPLYADGPQHGTGSPWFVAHSARAAEPY